MSSRSEASSRSRWTGRVRVREGARLAWYGPEATPDAWREYWRSHIGKGYDAAVRRRDLDRHPLGRVLRDELDRSGLHLEAGCGAGLWVAALEAAHYRVEGIENSAGLVDLVRDARPRLPVRVADALAIDRPDGTYDSYLSFGVIEHRREGPEPFLAEARRVLRADGLLVVSVPHFGPLRRMRARLGRYEAAPPDGLPFFQYGFRRDEFVRLVAEAGFVVRRALPIEAHRLLEEELLSYDRLASGRAEPWVRSAVEATIGRLDGHMAVVVADRAP